MKYITITCLLLSLCVSIPLSAKDYYVATNGTDTNAGTIEAPFATLNQALSVVQPGDYVYIRGGKYEITNDQIMNYDRGAYAAVFDITGKSGASASKRINIFGYEGERPVFDLSKVKPEGKRVSVFYVTGHFYHFKNFEIVGTQVIVKGHTQSECFSNDGGNNNIYENIAMHDGMAIGFYLTRGMNNLVLNCDAYSNYDDYSEGTYGGNVDGFGGHVRSAGSTGNVFRGCRAWYNSDDGFDLINCFAAVTIENCWAFRNGYVPNSETHAGDGTGFKSGGYGMQANPKVPDPIPVHVVRNCLAFHNYNKGFYANHHLGGIVFENNTGYDNPSNYCMLNRKSAAEVVDVDGYGHVIKNNLSYAPRSAGKHITDVNRATCEIVNNSFAPNTLEVAETDFESLDATQLTLPRKADGSLPDITFLKLTTTAQYKFWGMGCFADSPIDYSWMQEAAIVVEGNTARVVGSGSENFTKFYVNGEEVDFTQNAVDLSSYGGTLELKATTDNGGVATLSVKK